VPALEQALTEVVRRHPVLRTSLHQVGEQLEQRIDQERRIALMEEQVSSLEEWTSSRARERFDLARGPLFRAYLARLDAQDHCLLLAAHRAIVDSWSFEILMAELSDLYRAYCDARPSPLPAVELQFGDYAAWQQQCIRQGAHRAQLDYWRDRLHDAPSQQRRARRHCASTRVQLGSELGEALKSLATREGTTLYVVLLAAFKQLLLRRTGETDIVVGSRFAARTRAELTNMVGSFVHELPLRTKLDGASAFRDVIARVRETVAGAMSHQDVPLGDEVWFKTIFAFQNIPISAPRWGELDVETWNVDTSVDVDLVLSMQDGADGLSALAQYDVEQLADAPSLLQELVSFLEDVARDAGPVSPRRDVEPPRDGLERQLTDLFAAALGLSEVDIHDQFFARGGDSRSAIELAFAIETITGVRLPLSAMFDRPTVASLAAAIRARNARDASGPARLVEIVDGRAERPLFLVGGGRSSPQDFAVYAKLLAHARPGRAAFGLLAPADAETMQAIVASHLATIQRIQPQGPYWLSGECSGGLVAFEIAQQLRSRGHAIALLLLIDSMCPTTAGLAYHRFVVDPLIHLKAGIAFLRQLPSRAPSREPWPRELLRRAIPTAAERRYMRACDRYRPRPYEGRVSLLYCDENIRRGWANDWMPIARGGVDVYRTPGDRRTYASAFFEQTAEQLRSCLDAADAAQRGNG
jgi:thioesterase domain-containing protein/acyl carrier protein